MSPGDEERRPRAEAAQQSSMVTTASLDAAAAITAEPRGYQTAMAELDTIHAAFVAGYDTGYAKGRQDASEDLARDWLHAEAVRWTNQWVQDTTRLEKWEAGRAERERERVSESSEPRPWPPEDPNPPSWILHGRPTEAAERYHREKGLRYLPPQQGRLR